MTLTLGISSAGWTADLPLGHSDFLPTPQRPVGWRGDGSGCFPGATPPTQWDSTGKGVLWRATMPHQTMSSPIVVCNPASGGAKVITLADPHTILAYDADTGKRLWYNARDTFDLLCKDAGEAKAMRRLYDLYVRHFTQPQQGTQGITWSSKDSSGLDLVAERATAESELRAAGIDPTLTTNKVNHTTQHPFFSKYGLASFMDIALASTMSTPVSDGTSVWVLWSATRTVACYEVNTGKCTWMRWLGAHAKNFAGFNFNSPLLEDGVLVVRHEDKLSGLDPATGKDLWVLPAGKGNFSAANYSCETPLAAKVGGKKVVLMSNGTAVDVKTGAVVFPGTSWPKESVSKGKVANFGSSPFLGGPDVVVQIPGQYGDMAARKFTAKGMEPLLWGAKLDPVDGYVNEDTGQSLAYNGFVYLNDSGTSALIEVATGNLIPRGISGPNGGYPGCNIAGDKFFNFDGAASCTVTTLGPDGKLVAINHLIPGYAHTKRLTSAQGHGMKNPKGFTSEWWKQAFAARDEGVIGWVGRTWSLAAGEMSAGPFFQGNRIYLRTHTELICLGAKQDEAK
jgi:outer membrane protein assembly factor BamB